MGFMDEKFDKEKETAQKEQTAAIRAAVTDAVAAAVVQRDVAVAAPQHQKAMRCQRRTGRQRRGNGKFPAASRQGAASRRGNDAPR